MMVTSPTASPTRPTAWRRSTWLRSGASPRRSVVDVGVGTGTNAPKDREVVAVEPSSVMIAQRPPGAPPVVQGRAEGLPFPDRSFDAAIAIFTVHHWPDRRRGLSELVRVA